MPRAGKASRGPFVRICLLLIALALVYALTIAARNGLSDLYARPAKNYLQEKRDAESALTESEWEAINANLTQALLLAPNDPTNLTELGRLHRIQLEAEELDISEIERHGNLAIQYYERAAKLRPTWPWVWGGLALVRFELFQDENDAYHQALIRATHFGPWQASIQRLVVDLSLDTWVSLSPEAKRAVLGNIDRAIERQPEGLNAILDAEQSWQLFCSAATPAVSLQSEAGAAGELSRLRQHCQSLALN